MNAIIRNSTAEISCLIAITPEGNRITWKAEILHNQLREFNVVGIEKGYCEGKGKGANHAAVSAHCGLCGNPIPTCATAAVSGRHTCACNALPHLVQG